MDFLLQNNVSSLVLRINLYHVYNYNAIIVHMTCDIIIKYEVKYHFISDGVIIIHIMCNHIMKYEIKYYLIRDDPNWL